MSAELHNHSGRPRPFELYEKEPDFGRLSQTPGSVIEDIPDEPAGQGGATYLGLTVSDLRIKVFFGLIAAVLFFVFIRAFQVQVFQGDYYRQRAEGNRSRVEWRPSERGIIYARDGTALVRNIPDFTATIAPSELPRDPAERRQIIARVSEIVQAAPIDIENKVADPNIGPLGAVVVGEHLTHDQAVLIQIENGKYPAVALNMGTRREYSDTGEVNSLSHIIGYEGRVTGSDISPASDYQASDLIGKAGLERSYEALLRGKYGKKVVEIDAVGQKKTTISEEGPAAGSDLVLTIDVGLQKQAETILRDGLRAAGQKRGSLIVLQPQTGEVLAMVSEPAYDSNLFARGISAADFKKLNDNPDRPLFPRAIAASLPSGSTFKPVIAAAALQEKLITPETTVLSTGGIQVNKWFFPDWKAGGHGKTNVAKALAESVNTFFYAIGGGYEDITGLGVDRIIAYARKFGMGSRLGVDLAGEGAGFLPSKDWKKTAKGESWYVGDTYHLAIGQGDLLVTPLQIASMTAVFANGGKLIRPRVVNAVTSGDGTRRLIEPDVIDPQVVDPFAVEAVRRGLRQTVTAGSARSFADLPVAVAAKTGTAQWSTTKPTHAWFTSFAPYDDPKVVVTVVIEEGGEGSQTAAAVARRFYSWYFGPGREQP